MTKPKYSRPKKRFLSPEVLEATTKMTFALLEASGVKGAVVGGYAMQFYGSPRLTGDVDLVVSEIPTDMNPLKPIKGLTFGGHQYKTPDGVDVDLIARSDEFRSLYEEALENAVVVENDFPVLTPEYLAVAKMVAGRPKDEGDLLWLLEQPDLVDRKRALDIAGRLLGGRFAQDSLQSAMDEADWRIQKGKKG